MSELLLAVIVGQGGVASIEYLFALVATTSLAFSAYRSVGRSATKALTKRQPR